MREADEDDGFAEVRLYLGDEKLRRAGNDPALLDEAIELLSRSATVDFGQRPAALSRLADALHSRFAGSGDVTFLRRLAEADRQLSALPGAGRAALMNWAIDLRRLFETAGEPARLDEAVTALLAALAEPEVDDPSEALCRFELLIVYRSRFHASGDPDDLREAIRAGQAAVRSAAPDDPGYPEYHLGLGGVLLSAGRAAEAVVALREAARTTPRDDPDWPLHRATLGRALQEHFEQTGRAESLDDAITVLTGAAAAAGAGTPLRHEALADLTRCLAGRVDPDRVPGRDAAALAQRIVELAGDDGGAPVFLINLARIRFGRFEAAGDPDDLDAAVAAARRSLVLPLPPGADVADLRGTASRVLARAHRHRSDPVLRDESIDAGWAAVAAGDDELGGRLITLGGLLSGRFDETGVAADLDRAIDCGERALTAPAPDAATAARRRTVVAMDVRKRFERDGDPADLERAVALIREALQRPGSVDEVDRAESAVLAQSLDDLSDRLDTLTGRQLAVDAARRDFADADEKRRPETLNRLVQTLWSQARLTGDVTVIEEAISGIRSLIELLDGHGRSSGLANLGRQLRLLYDRTGDLAVLRESIETLDRLVLEADPDDPETGGYHSAAAVAFAEYGRRSGQTRYAVMATGMHRDAVAMTADDDPGYAIRLASLAVHLTDEYDRTGEPALIAEAVAGLRRALAALPPHSTDRAPLLTNLGNALRSSFRATGDRADLDASIAVTREALDLLAEGHHVRPGLLRNLGNTLSRRFETAGSVEDRDGAIAAFAEAARSVLGDPDTRALAAVSWGMMAAGAGRAAEAARGFAAAVEQLPALSPRSLTRGDQEHRLQPFSGLAGMACAAALDAGDPGRAVVLLEQSRGVLLAQLLETRGDTEALRHAYPALATDLEAAREMLNADAGPATGTADAAARTRREAAGNWQRVLDRVRALPSFEGFLLPPTVDELVGEAAGGPIVLLSSADHRSDALAVTRDGVVHVPLPGLARPESAERIRQFRAAAATFERPGLPYADYYAANLAMIEVLGWLWDVGAGPVLRALPGEDRVWWAPAGELAFLPWHAAGHHDRRAERPAPTVLDRVVSSYTPTLRTLVHLRELTRERDLTAEPLLVGLGETPGAAVLSEAAAEIDHLAARMPGARVLRDAAATHDAVLDRLRTASLAHFACHGVSFPGDPSQSRLLLHDAPLPVVEIVRLRLERAQLAYLSACSTTQASSRLTDEAIHITSAFQLAGYPHVVGTLWTVDDLVARELTERVYAGLPGDPASALHDAVREARDRDPDRPDLWAAHVHAGV